MRNVNRRDAVKLVAGLAVGAGHAGTARAEAPKPEAKDMGLVGAKQNPESYFFTEQVTFKTSTTEPHTFNLVISSALDEQGKRESVEVRQGTMRLFRAAADIDDFTRDGGIYWACGKTKGSFQFKKAGALVLIVREMDGTVRAYSLTADVRC